jgi:hypothetical protein
MSDYASITLTATTSTFKPCKHSNGWWKPIGGYLNGGA